MSNYHRERFGKLTFLRYSLKTSAFLISHGGNSINQLSIKPNFHVLADIALVPAGKASFFLELHANEAKKVNLLASFDN